MGNLQLTSFVFPPGGKIPRECGYKHANRSPLLTISGIPKGTKSLALIMDDPDAMNVVVDGKKPYSKPYVHWVFCNFDPTPFYNKHGKYNAEIAEEFSQPIYKFLTGKEDLMVGITDFGKWEYCGPAPPDKIHTYVFKLYALDSKLDLLNGFTKADLEKAMEGHIIEHTQLTGTYAP